MKMLVDMATSREVEQMRRVVISLLMANRAEHPVHARRLLRQAIMEAEELNN